MKSLRIKTSRSQQESKSSPRQYPASAADTLTVESTSCVIQNIRKKSRKIKYSFAQGQTWPPEPGSATLS